MPGRVSPGKSSRQSFRVFILDRVFCLLGSHYLKRRIGFDYITNQVTALTDWNIATFVGRAIFFINRDFTADPKWVSYGFLASK